MIKHFNVSTIMFNMKVANRRQSNTRDDEEFSVMVKGNTRSTSGDPNLEAALAGLGFVALPIWMLDKYLKSEKLIRLLPDYQGSSIPINIIYPQNRYAPLKVRCFVDFIKQKVEENHIFR